MSCFGGTPVALKEEYLKNTPFFLLAAETDDATILPELARYATVKKFNASAQISDKLAYNTFVVVVEGELIHSDITAKLSTSTTSKIFPVDEIVATRKTGDFFRVAGLSSKESRVGGYARLMTVRKTTLLLLTPAALAAVLPRHIGAGGDGKYAQILHDISKQDLVHQLERVPFLSALETRVRHGLAELFSFEILGADATLFSQGDVGERFTS